MGDNPPTPRVKLFSAPRTNAANHTRVPPGYSGGNTYVPSSHRTAFQRDIGPNDFKYLYKRDGHAYRIVEAPARDVFSKRPEITAENQDAADEIATILGRCEYWREQRETYKWSRLYGSGILVIFYEGGAPDMSLDITGARAITGFAAYSSQAIDTSKGYKGRQIDTDKNSPTFGQLMGIYLKTRVANSASQTTLIHRDRFVLLEPNVLDDEVGGMSCLLPPFDDFTVKKNQDYAMGEFIRRAASGVATLHINNANLGLDEEELDELEKDFYLGARNEFLFRGSEDDVKFNWHFPKGSINPAPYTDHINDNISAGAFIPKTHILGSQAGAVTGSEVNREEYASFIHGEQMMVLEPALREVLERMVRIGQIADQEYFIEWPSIYDVSDKDMAMLNNKRAQTVRLNAMTVDLLLKAAVPFTIVEGQVILTDTEQGGAGGDKAAVTPTPEPAPTPNAQAVINYSMRSEEEHKALSDEWYMPTGGLEMKLQGAVLGWLEKEQTKLDAWIEAHASSKEGILNRLMKRTNDERDVQDALDYAMDEKALRKTIEPSMRSAVELGVAETLTKPGMNMLPDLTDVTTIDYLENQTLLASRSYSDTTVTAVRRALIDGVRAKETVAQLARRVQPIMGKAGDRAAVLARTEIAAAANRGRLEVFQANGVERVEFLATYDERTCEICGGYDGKEMTVDEAMGLLPVHPMCRCTFITILSGGTT